MTEKEYLAAHIRCSSVQAFHVGRLGLLLCMRKDDDKRRYGVWRLEWYNEINAWRQEINREYTRREGQRPCST